MQVQRFNSKEHTVFVSRNGDEVDVSLVKKGKTEGIKARFETEQAKDMALGVLDCCDEIECEHIQEGLINDDVDS